MTQWLTADRAAAWLPRSVACTAAVSLVLAALTTKEGLSHWTAAWALAVLLPSLVLAARPASPSVADQRREDHATATAWLLALNGIALFLVVPAALAMWPGESITGWRSPFLDKRWLIAAYAVGMIGLGLAPVVIARALRSDHELPTPTPDTAARPRWISIAELLIVVAAVWYLAGPPWNIGAHPRGIDPSEQVLLGPLHAISRGVPPFVDAASTSWGPGSQVIVYAYMSMADRFNVVGFREATLLVHFIAALTVALVAWAQLGLASSWIAIALAMIVSPLGSFSFQADGAFGDAYGSATPLRFMAPLIVVPAVTLIASRTRANARVMGHLVGVAWALFAWADQSNLLATGFAAVAALVLCFATSSTSWPRVRVVAASVMAGFAVVWLPILGWYAIHGQLIAFVANYWMLPRAFAGGFANTTWMADAGDPWGRAFHWLPLFIVTALVATVWDLRQWRVRQPLSTNQLTLVAFLCVLAACYPWALERSDPRHLVEAMTALPFVLVLLFRDLPAWIAQTQASRAIMRVAVVWLVIGIFPIGPRLMTLYADVVRPPAAKYRVPQAPVPSNAGAASGRGGLLSDNPFVFVDGTGSMRKFLADAEALKALIGDRPTFVHSAGPYRAGLVLFAANLLPAPQLLTEALIINDRVQSKGWQHFQAHLDRIECVIASSPEAFEVKTFLAAHPSATLISRPLGVGTVLIALTNGPAS